MKHRSPYDKYIRKYQRKLWKRDATKHRPRWAKWAELIDFYKNTPHGLCVDHIIPLHGEGVSGLHVVWNLQYLTLEENVRKGNKY